MIALPRELAVVPQEVPVIAVEADEVVIVHPPGLALSGRAREGTADGPVDMTFVFDEASVLSVTAAITPQSVEEAGSMIPHMAVGLPMIAQEPAEEAAEQVR